MLQSRIHLIIFLLLPYLNAFTQESLKQTIRGVVIDKQTQQSLPSAVLILSSVSPNYTVASDLEGRFRFDNIVIGRHTLIVKYIGYKEMALPILLNAGKEVVLTIELEENAEQLKEVVISANSDKSKASNEMSAVSTRMMSMEESNRYAGTRNDPARMAANFAGVSGGSDQRNDIIIRGNSPSNLLWRLEGVDIPNPNHFAVNGASSGPISILNNNSLANSDFSTGAFAAEYMNATSGVFDLKMRNGNNEKREYIAQIGVNGVELGAEGPISNSKKSASYMVNYRYSNLIVMQKLGVNFGSGSTPAYQDGSFKVLFPLKKGNISMFGIAGKSDISLLARNEKPGDVFRTYYFDYIYGGNMYATGINYNYQLNKKGFLKFTLAQGNEGIDNKTDSNNATLTKQFIYERQLFIKRKTSFNVILSQKYNSRFTLKLGALNDLLAYELNTSKYLNGDKNLKRILFETTGKSFLNKSFIEGIYKPNGLVTIYPGVSFLYLAFNNTYSIEPRLSIQYVIDDKQSMSTGFGIHSRMPDLTLLNVSATNFDGTKNFTNKNLNFYKAAHFVVAYNNNITSNFRIKAETYYQYLYHIPIEQRPSSFSFINAGANFGIPLNDSLVNKGTGTNYGIEFTAEKFFSKTWYFLLTGSLFNSTYKGSDGISRSTAFNNKVVSNFLIGKEIRLNQKNSLALDFRGVYAGGRRATPINFNASQKIGRTVYFEDKAWSNQLKDYIRLDIKIAFKHNVKHVTHEIAISAENITNRANLFALEYDAANNRQIELTQLKLFIVGFYRVNF